MNVRVEPSGPLVGRIRVPADKSISHRAAILAAMGDGETIIDGYLAAADTLSTLAALRGLGAGVRADGGRVQIRGCGLAGARPPVGAIDVGNAGTLLRLLPGWLAGQEGRSFTLDGDASIRRRPVDRVMEPLELMGARVQAREGRFPPFTIKGATLNGIEYRLPMASAQVKSCVLLAGLRTEATTVEETLPSRDHTERMLLGAGAALTRTVREDGAWLTRVQRSTSPVPGRIAVPGDFSSAAFLLAAGALVPGSRLVVENVGVNWTRTGFARILERMGAAVDGELEPPGGFDPAEPVSDLDIASGELRGTTVPAEEVPLSIDELPLVALLGCFASGETVVHGAAELRFKESDRIAAVVAGLRGLGAEAEALSDGIAVRGRGELRGGRLDARGDHRLALLGAVAGLASRTGVEVVGMEAAGVSYPGFLDDLSALASATPGASRGAHP